MGNRFQVGSRVQALQYNAAGLLSLLGGDDNDRERFLEIWKGITTPVEMRVVENLFDTMNHQVEGVQNTLHSLQALAQGIQDRAA